MKRFLVVLFILSVCAAASAQSGRKVINAQPSPSPTPTREENSGFSDSLPVKTKKLKPKPNLRGGDNSDSGSVATANKTPSPAKTTQSADADEEVLRVETALITVPVTVADRQGRYIPSLRQEDFKIFENGKEQEIAVFNTSEQPFTVVLLLDVSPSTEYKIEEIQNAAISFVNQLKPNDRVMVIEFDQSLNVLAEPTSDRQKLYKAIRKADFGNGTSLYDAVKNVITKRVSQIEGRKAIVIFTDGVDTTSYKAGYDDTLRDAEELDAMIFPVYYDTYNDQRDRSGGLMTSPFPPFPFPGGGQRGGSFPRRPTLRDYERGRKYLGELATRTGGRLYDTETHSGGLEGAFAGIAEELRRQYTIGYYPQVVGEAGERKQIKVRVLRPDLIVRARDSYVVGTSETPPATATEPRKLSLK